jgi:hypothetical protein
MKTTLFFLQAHYYLKQILFIAIFKNNFLLFIIWPLVMHFAFHIINIIVKISINCY